MLQQIKVIDSLGNEENFSERKVLRSLKKTGASSKVAQLILDRLKPHLYNGVTTSEIFKFDPNNKEAKENLINIYQNHLKNYEKA
jgi:DeoR/GlpR family transcriptional regulator of sugar metabolism